MESRTGRKGTGSSTGSSLGKRLQILRGHMKRRRLVLIWLLAASCVAAIPFLTASSSRAGAPKDTKDSFDAWARDNYDRALDLVLQDRCTSATDARWLSCIRIVPGYPDELEYSLSVEKRYDGTVLAEIARPKVDSIRRQLRDRKKEHPHASVGDLAKLIELESRAVDQRRFPGIVRLADEFEKIRVSPVLSDEIMMDATQYRF